MVYKTNVSIKLKKDIKDIKDIIIVGSGPIGLYCAVHLISNKEKYMDHPNIKAIAVLKMKGLFIDEIRKNQKMTSMTDDEGNDLQVVDDKQNDISERIGLKDETKKVLSAIKTMGEKCQEILMLASEGMSMQEMQEVTGVKSLGTVLSRLSNCRKELKGLVA